MMANGWIFYDFKVIINGLTKKVSKNSKCSLLLLLLNCTSQVKNSAFCKSNHFENKNYGQNKSISLVKEKYKFNFYKTNKQTKINLLKFDKNILS